MKRYIRSAASVDYKYLINRDGYTHIHGENTYITLDKDYQVIIHPDNTVEYGKYYSSSQNIPPKALKDALLDKYGPDLMFLDDIEKANETPINTIEDAQQLILNSKLGDAISRWDEDGSSIRERLSDPNWTGSFTIAHLNTTKGKPVKRDFYLATGISEEQFMTAMRLIHPNSEINLTWYHHNKDKYANRGIYARPAYTDWRIEIK